jgi:SagB-type dehydrogenase family enzyme
MGGNAASEIAQRFNDRTTHTPRSVRTSGHTLDWDVKPFPFKVYTEAPAVTLPRELDPVVVSVLEPGERPASQPLTLDGLAALLYYTAGVTKKKTYPGGGEVLFRAAASTGALYQTELYVAAGNVVGLGPGLYHFCPGDFTLRRLRGVDVRAPLAEAAADERLARSPATLILTAIYWRNTWKYQARGYRHLFWDSGTMLANLLAVGRALGLDPRLVTGFVDTRVNDLLGLDDAYEAALELVGLGAEGSLAPAADALELLHAPTLPLSSREVDYPALREIHRASILETPAEVTSWRRALPPTPPPPPLSLAPLPRPVANTGRPLGETIQRRGSTRQFSHDPLTLTELGAALWLASRPVPADVGLDLVNLYLVANAVEGLAPGAYAYWPERHGLELIRAGEFRRESAFLCLEQPLGGDAAAVLYYLAPLTAVLGVYGNRGYRLVNLAAGLGGGRAYLAAYALGFGASGLTFYDDKVVEFFAPHATGRAAVFVTALGRPARRPAAGA